MAATDGARGRMVPFAAAGAHRCSPHAPNTGASRSPWQLLDAARILASRKFRSRGARTGSGIRPSRRTAAVYEDRTLICRDCGDSFIFSGGEQRFFAEKGLQNIPQRCPSCRANAKRVRMGGPREYHAAVCNACGNQAMVPFAPRTDRPVYCSTCFDKVRAGMSHRAAAAPVPSSSDPRLARTRSGPAEGDARWA